MKIHPTDLPGVILIEPRVFGDPRGFFMETYHQLRYQEDGVAQCFVQDNHSRSCQGVLRGLHYQLIQPQGKLVWTARGSVFDVAVDIRRGSPTFGRWVSVILDDVNHRQLYIPPGFAHGFCVLSDKADFFYKCTDYYHPQSEQGILWNDPDIGVTWPMQEPTLSDKDARLPRLAEQSPDKLPLYSG